jgi:hypothetical protein
MIVSLDEDIDIIDILNIAIHELISSIACNLTEALEGSYASGLIV